MTHQLRIYRIADSALGQFVSEWRESVVPLRRDFGFEVVDAWASEEACRFVWILGYGGAGSFAERDAAYYASPERSALDPDPARLVVEFEASLAVKVDLG